MFDLHNLGWRFILNYGCPLFKCSDKGREEPPPPPLEVYKGRPGMTVQQRANCYRKKAVLNRKQARQRALRELLETYFDGSIEVLGPYLRGEAGMVGVRSDGEGEAIDISSP